MREPLEEANKYMRKEIEKNFESEGATFGNKWKGLTPGYQGQKQRKFGSQKILQATGAMRAAFVSKTTATVSTISNKAHYFKYHQSSAPRRKMPRRVMMEITRTQQAEILRFFTKYLNKLKNG